MQYGTYSLADETAESFRSLSRGQAEQGEELYSRSLIDSSMRRRPMWRTSVPRTR